MHAAAVVSLSQLSFSARLLFVVNLLCDEGMNFMRAMYALHDTIGE